jgi:hypothetical protein
MINITPGRLQRTHDFKQVMSMVTSGASIARCQIRDRVLLLLMIEFHQHKLLQGMHRHESAGIPSLDAVVEISFAVLHMLGEQRFPITQGSGNSIVSLRVRLVKSRLGIVADARDGSHSVLGYAADHNQPCHR